MFSNCFKNKGASAFKKLYPFESHFMDRKGLKYHYLDEGKGEPVLMLHGNPTWSFYYRNLVKTLSPDFRTIVPDHIGCGFSDKPPDNSNNSQYDYRLKSRVADLEALLKHLNIKENITLVLHDWGGMIGMAYAVRHPESIKKIVVLNTAAFLLPKEKPFPLRLRIIRNLPFFSNIAVQGFNLFAYPAVFMATHKGLSRDVRLMLKSPYNSWKNRIATLRFVQDIPLYPKDASYALVESVDKNLFKLKDKPMLICWGKHDFVFDLKFLNEWQKRFPKAEAHIFEDAGHYVLEDAAKEVCELVKNFLWI